MKTPNVFTIDFETQPIVGSWCPPKPVGFSLRKPGDRKSTYHRWGHPSGNNCSLADGKRILQQVWKPSNDLLFHNAKFDVAVAEAHMGVPRHPALKTHDTMLLLFLRDPHAPDLQLKPSAMRYLGLPPEEQDAVHDWAKKNKAELLLKHFTKPFRPGAYIGYAPGDIVDPYARGDTDRTFGLFKDCFKYVNDANMMEPYQREQGCMPIFLDNEQTGIRVDTEALRRDVGIYEKALDACDAWLRKRLKSNSLNINSDADFAEALAQAGVVDDDQWTFTKSGQRSVAKGNLTPEMFNDVRVARAFGYRNRLQTCLNMFMRPWLVQATLRNGWVSTNWNQVRSAEYGTRTGRPSTSDPNFLNISKTWGVDDGYIHPDFLKVLELPLVRRYMLPDAFALWLHRDYNGQELRVLADAEDGPLLAAYKENPRLDVHQFVSDLIEGKTGKRFARKNVKIANFRIIYGGGAPATAAGIGCSLVEAKELLEAHGRALPSIKGKGGISDQTKDIGKRGDALITWGGREYYVEAPGYSKKYGRHMTYEYKLLNYYCQGSAADITKQALINYDSHPKRRGRFLVTVYDEINSSSPGAKAEKARMAAAREEMAVLRESMECVSEQMDVAMLSDGKIGPTWGDQESYKEGKSDYE